MTVKHANSDKLKNKVVYRTDCDNMPVVFSYEYTNSDEETMFIVRWLDPLTNKWEVERHDIEDTRETEKTIAWIQSYLIDDLYGKRLIEWTDDEGLFLNRDDKNTIRHAYIHLNYDDALKLRQLLITLRFYQDQASY